MGRYYFDAKTTVEDSLVLSIFTLNEWSLLECSDRYTTVTWTRSLSGYKDSVGLHVYAGRRDEPYISLQYAHTDHNGGSERYLYNVLMVTTVCNFGGVRYWFLCPLNNCGRRVAKLYKPPGGKYFGCRHCHDLSYESRNESRLGRFGNIGYGIVSERKIEELYGQIKRWTWRGKPTRKARKLKALEGKMDAYESGPSVEELLLYGK